MFEIIDQNVHVISPQMKVLVVMYIMLSDISPYRTYFLPHVVIGFVSRMLEIDKAVVFHCTGTVGTGKGQKAITVSSVRQGSHLCQGMFWWMRINGTQQTWWTMGGCRMSVVFVIAVLVDPSDLVS